MMMNELSNAKNPAIFGKKILEIVNAKKPKITYELNISKKLKTLNRFSEKFQDRIKELEEKSSVNTGLNLTIAINYGSRDEMLRAVKHMMTDHANGVLTLEEVTPECFSSYLDTKDLPDPDLMIRTSGEQRLSNYLLWQLAYSEFYFTDVPWPDFNKKELERAIEAYNKRDRRFGGLKET